MAKYPSGKFGRMSSDITPTTMSKTIPSEMGSPRPPRTPDPARSSVPNSIIKNRVYDRTAGKKK